MKAWLIMIGLVLVAVGLLWPWLAKLGLGRLPGDIIVERGSFSFYFPIVTCLVVSVVLSLTRVEIPTEPAATLRPTSRGFLP